MHIAEPIKLRQARDFGQIFNDTFAFLRANWKPLFRAILTVGLPAALIGGFLSGNAMASLQQGQAIADQDPTEALRMMGGGFMGMVPGMLLVAFAWMMVVACVHEYLRAYHLGEHMLLSTGDLLKRGLGQLGPYFGASFLTGLLTAVGFMLCLLPALYPATVLCLTLAAHAIERTGGAGALGRSNQLVSSDFFPTLGLVVVMFLLKLIVDQVLVLPFTIAGLVIGVDTGLEAVREGGGVQFPAWMSVFNAVSSAYQWCVTMLTYPIVAIAFVLKYFSRVEEAEGVGLRERLSEFDQA